MAIYRFSVSIIGKSGGRSAVSAAAYRAAEKIKNERTGLTHDFTKKEDDLARILCVLATVRGLNFRFGPNRIVQILAGSRAQEILDRGLDQQPTFGALRVELPASIRALVHWLSENDLLALEPFETSSGFRGHTVGITAAASEINRTSE